MLRRAPRSPVLLLVALLSLTSVAAAAVPAGATLGARAADVKAVARAAKKTIAAGTVAYKASVSTGGSVIKADAKAGFDPPRVTMDADLSGSGLPITGVVPGRVIDGALYLELGNVLPFGTPWVKVDLASLGSAAGTALGAAGSASPDLGFGLLLGTTAATRKGTQKIRGEDTVHYTASIDPQAAVDAAPASLRDTLSKLVAGGAIAADVWVDGKGRIARLEQKFTTASGSTETSYDVLRYGIPVEVEALPASQVTDISALLGSLLASFGLGTAR